MTEIVDALNLGNCPTCGKRGFILGPRGGIAINVECANLKCRARYNVVMHPLIGGAVLWAEEIASEARGGARWGIVKEYDTHWRGTRS